MSAKKNSNKLGGALAVAMMVMLIFSALAIGLYKLFQRDAVETVLVEQHRRAFWMAEAGLEAVLSRLQWDEDFRNNPGFYVPYTESFSDGIQTNDSYKIASISASSVGATGTLYTIRSVGYAGNLNRQIELQTLARPGSTGPLRSEKGDVNIDGNVFIDGNVLADEGDVNTDSKENLNSQNPTGVDGFVLLGTGSVTGKGAPTVDVIEAPLPPAPVIDMTFWKPFLDGVTTNANTNGLIGVSTIDMTTVVSNYIYTVSNVVQTVMPSDPSLKLTISGSANDPVYNLHYMVSATSIMFAQNTVLESQTAIIVDGDVTFAQQLTFYSNCLVFATGDIYVRQASDASGLGATLIAQGDVNMEQNMIFKGVIIADGTVNLGQNSVIAGTVSGADGINVAANSVITYDPDVFLNPLPGLSNVTSQATLVPVKWAEVEPE